MNETITTTGTGDANTVQNPITQTTQTIMYNTQNNIELKKKVLDSNLDTDSKIEVLDFISKAENINSYGYPTYPTYPTYPLYQTGDRISCPPYPSCDKVWKSGSEFNGQTQFTTNVSN